MAVKRSNWIETRKPS